MVQIINNQLEEGKPESTVIAYEAFQNLGYSKEDAKKLIGSVLMDEMVHIMQTGEEFDEDRYTERLVDLLKEQLPEDNEDEIPEHMNLKDALLIDNDEDMLNMIAYEYDVESDDDEEVTAQRIADHLLDPDHMRQMILDAKEGTAELIQRILKNPDMEITDDEFDLLTECGDLHDCLFAPGTGTYLIPDDVAEVWKKVYTKKFEKKRRKYVWLRSCLITAAYYYGILNMDVLMNLLNQEPSIQMNTDEVYELMDEIPEQKRLFVKVGNRLVYRDLIDTDWQRLEKIQGNYPFVLPSVQEIRDLDLHHYPYHEKGWKEMRESMEDSEFSFLEADLFPILFHRMTIADSEEDIEDIMKGVNLMPDEDDFGMLWTILYGNTRLLALRGGKRSEGKQPAELDEEILDALMNLEDRVDGDDPGEEDIGSCLFS